MLALAVVPIVVAVGFQSAWAAWACAIDGKARDRCCCKSERDQVPRDRSDDVPHFERQDCCQVATHDVLSAPAAREVERIAFDFAPAIETVTPIALNPVHSDRQWSFAEVARPPPRHVPIYIDKQALLR